MGPLRSITTPRSGSGKESWMGEWEETTDIYLIGANASPKDEVMDKIHFPFLNSLYTFGMSIYKISLVAKCKQIKSYSSES